MKRHINIPVFIPHEGCPNDCIFCNQRKISGSLHAPSESEMRDIIERHLETAAPQDVCEIAFFGGSFTGLPNHAQEKYLSVAVEYVKKGFVQGIRLSTRPDYISEEILSMLKRYSVKTIELGIQSLDEDVLKKSKRFYSPEEAINACLLVKRHGFFLGVQTMIGLPCDTLEKSLLTAKRLIAVDPDMVRIYPTLVIRETELETEYNNGHYLPLSLDEAVFWCSKMIPLYNAANVQVLRIGLQYTENMKQGMEVAAGPVHPSFGELVYSEIWRNMITEELEKSRGKTGTSLIVHVSPAEVSKVIGQHRRNLQFFINAYGFTSVRVVGDRDISGPPFLEFQR